MKQWKIRYRHVEGDGVNSVATGRASGVYTATESAESLKEAVRAFDACHRHGDTLLGVSEVQS